MAVSWSGSFKESGTVYNHSNWQCIERSKWNTPFLVHSKWTVCNCPSRINYTKQLCAKISMNKEFSSCPVRLPIEWSLAVSTRNSWKPTKLPVVTPSSFSDELNKRPIFDHQQHISNVHRTGRRGLTSYDAKSSLVSVRKWDSLDI